jgi:hypothetical protein
VILEKMYLSALPVDSLLRIEHQRAAFPLRWSFWGVRASSGPGCGAFCVRASRRTPISLSESRYGDRDTYSPRRHVSAYRPPVRYA